MCVNLQFRDDKFTMFFENVWMISILSWTLQGYALLCVGFPSSDLEVETQDEDEVNCKLNFSLLENIIYVYLILTSNRKNKIAVSWNYLGVESLFACISDNWLVQVYWLQFGRYFARGPIVSSEFLKHSVNEELWLSTLSTITSYEDIINKR